MIGSPLLLHLTILSLSVQPHLQFLTGGAASPLHAVVHSWLVGERTNHAIDDSHRSGWTVTNRAGRRLKRIVIRLGREANFDS